MNIYTVIQWLIKQGLPVLLWGAFCYVFAGLILLHAGTGIHLLIAAGCTALAVLEASRRAA